MTGAHIALATFFAVAATLAAVPSFLPVDPTPQASPREAEPWPLRSAITPPARRSADPRRPHGAAR